MQIRMNIYACIDVQLYVPISICVCVPRACARFQIFIPKKQKSPARMCMYVCMYIYTYTYTFINTYNTNIYKYKYSCMRMTHDDDDHPPNPTHVLDTARVCEGMRVYVYLVDGL
jgi:hypothetical protein